jgi:hypothetical protein
MILENLSDDVRMNMEDEVNYDIKKDVLFVSNRLKDNYEDIYKEMLFDAIREGDVTSFAYAIEDNDCLREFEPSSRAKNGFKKVPSNANELLAEGEFNRFYIMGLCKKAIDEDLILEIYRAKEVKKPRSASEDLIGNEIDLEDVLNDLRESIGVDTVLGVLSGPGSGLSVRIKKK